MLSNVIPNLVAEDNFRRDRARKEIAEARRSRLFRRGRSH
jgi:hypothetical protein